MALQSHTELPPLCFCAGISSPRAAARLPRVSQLEAAREEQEPKAGAAPGLLCLLGWALLGLVVI